MGTFIRFAHQIHTKKHFRDFANFKAITNYKRLKMFPSNSSSSVVKTKAPDEVHMCNDTYPTRDIFWGVFLIKWSARRTINRNLSARNHIHRSFFPFISPLSAPNKTTPQGTAQRCDCEKNMLFAFFRQNVLPYRYPPKGLQLLTGENRTIKLRLKSPKHLIFLLRFISHTIATFPSHTGKLR